MLTLEQAEKKFTDQVAIRFDQALHGERELLATLSILKRHPGKCDTAIIVETFDPGNPNQRLRHLLSNPALKVSVGGSLAEELQALLGTTSVQFLTKNKPRKSGGGGFSQN
jgi:hypothetical protein